MLVRVITLILSLIVQNNLAGYVLDGSVTPTVIYNTYNFSDGDIALGQVYFKNGFNVPAGATVSLQVSVPIDGAIDLNGTGRINVYTSPFLLGPRCTGFPNGGIFYGLFDQKIQLANDISIGGQLVIQDTEGFAFLLQGNTLTLADNGSSRGSFLLIRSDNMGVPYGNLQFIGGSLIGMQDFKTGYGPRIRSAGYPSGIAYWLQDTTILLAPDSTMTLTNCVLASPRGINYLKTPSKAKVNAFSNIILYTEGSMFLGPGVTMVTPYCGWYNVNNTIIGLDNATMQINSLASTGGGAMVVKGKSYLCENGLNSTVNLNATQLDIAGGATLVCDGILLNEF